jgi:hypothetical protein
VTMEYNHTYGWRIPGATCARGSGTRLRPSWEWHQRPVNDSKRDMGVRSHGNPSREHYPNGAQQISGGIEDHGRRFEDVPLPTEMYRY